MAKHQQIIAAAAWFMLSGTAFAQHAPVEGISESTDPQKIAEVEQRARDIIERQQDTSGDSGTSARETQRDAMPDRYREPGMDRMNRGHRERRMPSATESERPPQR